MGAFVFPKPFAKPPQSSDMGGAKRSTTSSLKPIPRALRLQKMREEEQAEMRKGAAHLTGEWVNTVSGVALFIPERMFQIARAMQETEVGAVSGRSLM